MRLLRRWIGGQSTGTPPECKRTFKRRLHRGLTSIRRYGSLNFAELVGKPFPKYQIYVSSSSDPYLNLSIEHFLLQKTPKDSTILYFYVNRPCVVIGRNQNPWVEANLRALVSSQVEAKANDQAVTEPILLVRRRSGGGTVFHDQGNVNYCVICPSAEFTRDKHAMMVATALRSIGVSRARVNRRHDIVLDSEVEDESIRSSSPVGSHLPAKDIERARLPKISGSAYKLTRGRCLHHGTCLLSSPNLHRIPWILRSPAKPYIKAKGVESISSPVSNVNVSMEAFRKAVMEAFGNLYGLNIDSFTSFPQKQGLHEDLGWAGGVVNETEIHVPEIERGVKELMVCEEDSPWNRHSTYYGPESLQNGSICRHRNSRSLALH